MAEYDEVNETWTFSSEEYGLLRERVAYAQDMVLNLSMQVRKMLKEAPEAEQLQKLQQMIEGRTFDTTAPIGLWDMTHDLAILVPEYEEDDADDEEAADDEPEDTSSAAESSSVDAA